jgi:hypothetical protein
MCVRANKRHSHARAWMLYAHRHQLTCTPSVGHITHRLSVSLICKAEAHTHTRATPSLCQASTPSLCQASAPTVTPVGQAQTCAIGRPMTNISNTRSSWKQPTSCRLAGQCTSQEAQTGAPSCFPTSILMDLRALPGMHALFSCHAALQHHAQTANHALIYYTQDFSKQCILWAHMCSGCTQAFLQGSCNRAQYMAPSCRSGLAERRAPTSFESELTGTNQDALHTKADMRRVSIHVHPIQLQLILLCVYKDTNMCTLILAFAYANLSSSD